MEPLTDCQKTLIESGLRVVWGEVSQALERGFRISDEQVSDAHWELIRAAQRHAGDDGSFAAYVGVCVRGALCRAFKNAKRHSNRGVEAFVPLAPQWAEFSDEAMADSASKCSSLRKASRYPNRSLEAFELFADDSCRRTDTVEELEASSPDLQWADFSGDATGDVARDLRLLRIGLSQIEGALKPVAEAMAEGVGIRSISDRLGLTFYEARTKYGEVLFQLRSRLGPTIGPEKERTMRLEQLESDREQIRPVLDRLSGCLKPVATALLNGQTQAEIAGKLGLSRRIIEWRVSEIRRIARGSPAKRLGPEQPARDKKLEKDCEQIGPILGQLSEKLKPVATALLEGKTSAEIAEKLGASLSNIWGRVSKIRRIARDAAAGGLQPTPALGSGIQEVAAIKSEEQAIEAELPSPVPPPTSRNLGRTQVRRSIPP